MDGAVVRRGFRWFYIYFSQNRLSGPALNLTDGLPRHFSLFVACR